MATRISLLPTRKRVFSTVSLSFAVSREFEALSFTNVTARPDLARGPPPDTAGLASTSQTVRYRPSRQRPVPSVCPRPLGYSSRQRTKLAALSTAATTLLRKTARPIATTPSTPSTPNIDGSPVYRRYETIPSSSSMLGVDREGTRPDPEPMTIVCQSLRIWVSSLSVETEHAGTSSTT
ncbi:hypothetical protein BCR34DRAFT_586148 [Clohesyomyces aquaticus]|uniref:Uncharacterized protein n=1 Tax=Clohesyomyces aquaticus TaxID=1231657 RepID=A0A1Y1ZUJ0_9PLEO|nr:hypothetical protein BCR34DRAFT_586148 [Clohesyomyces aquaticus]